MRIHFDGALQSQDGGDDLFNSGGGTSYDNTVPFQISGINGSNQLWDGPIGEVCVWGRVLTTAEHLELATPVNGVYPSGMDVSFYAF